MVAEPAGKREQTAIAEQPNAISHNIKRAAVQQALVAMIGIADNDYFQIITEYDGSDFAYNRTYLGVERSDT